MRIEHTSEDQIAEGISAMVVATILQRVRAAKGQGVPEKEGIRDAVSKGVIGLGYVLTLASMEPSPAKEIVRRAIRLCEENLNVEISLDTFDIWPN